MSNNTITFDCNTIVSKITTRKLLSSTRISRNISDYSVEDIELSPQETHTINNILYLIEITANGDIQAELTKNAESITINMGKKLYIDGSFDSIVLTNTNSVESEININTRIVKA